MKKCISLLFMVILLFVPAVIVPAESTDPAETTDAIASAFPAGDPEDVAAVILHTNDVHVGYQDNIGYDGLALYKRSCKRPMTTCFSSTPATRSRVRRSEPSQRARIK